MNLFSPLAGLLAIDPLSNVCPFNTRAFSAGAAVKATPLMQLVTDFIQEFMSSEEVVLT